MFCSFQGTDEDEAGELQTDVTEAQEAACMSGIEAEELDARQNSGRQAGPLRKRRPAWEDPDEEHLQLDVAAVSRLRKLRSAEAETTLTGVHLHTYLSTSSAQREGWSSAL